MCNHVEYIEREANLYERFHKGEGRVIDRNLMKRILETVDEQGHSGSSIAYVRSYLMQLMCDEEGTKKKLDDMLLVEDDDATAKSMQKLITENIYALWELIKPLAEWQQIFAVKLFMFEPTTPILDEPDQWKEVSKHGLARKEKAVYQHKRKSSVFKIEFENGLVIAYDIDAECYSDNGGINFFSTGRFGRRQIKFPYEPKSELIYLYQPDENNYNCTYILTDPDTIAKLKEIERAERDKVL